MRKLNPLVGTFAVVMLSLIPLIIWVAMMPLSFRFSGSAQVLTSLGQLTALVGMAMFSLSLLLQSRLGMVETLFGGLDRMYRAHHFFGTISFALLLFHPMFLALRFVSTSLRDAALFLLPGNSLAIDLGIYSLVLFEALMVITLFLKWKYHKWKLSHSFLSFAFFLGGMHMFFVSSDVSRSMPLRAYMLALAVSGLLSFVARKVFPQRNRYEYRVQQVRKLNNAVTEISLTPAGRPMEYCSGQFAYVSFWSQNISREWHPFSISSAPGDAVLRFTVKDLGDFTSTLPLLAKNDTAIIEGPYGRFSFELFNENDQLWIAAGIGITPFLSMARSLQQKHRQSVVLVYVAGNIDEAVCLEELESISKVHKHFKLVLYLSSREGRITAEKIRQKVKDAAAREIFICGPPPMMQSLKRQFASMGAKDVHTEEFVMR